MKRALKVMIISLIFISVSEFILSSLIRIIDNDNVSTTKELLNVATMTPLVIFVPVIIDIGKMITTFFIILPYLLIMLNIIFNIILYRIDKENYLKSKTFSIVIFMLIIIGMINGAKLVILLRI